MPSISFIIPAFNEEAYIGECLESIGKYRSAAVKEIIVVDNASTDRTAEVARKFQGVTVVREDKKGTSAARQRGYLTATGDLLAFIDADCHLTPEWCGIVEREFAAHPDIVCVSGMFRYYDLPKLQEWFIRFWWRFGGGIIFFFTGYLVVGGNFVAKKTAIEQMGGFDTSIPFYGDDTDTAKRLKKAGPTRFVPSLTVVTSGRRWTNEGFLRIGIRYIVNFFSEVFFSKPFTNTHKNIR